MKNRETISYSTIVHKPSCKLFGSDKILESSCKNYNCHSGQSLVFNINNPDKFDFIPMQPYHNLNHDEPNMFQSVNEISMSENLRAPIQVQKNFSIPGNSQLNFAVPLSFVLEHLNLKKENYSEYLFRPTKHTEELLNDYTELWTTQPDESNSLVFQLKNRNSHSVDFKVADFLGFVYPVKEVKGRLKEIDKKNLHDYYKYVYPELDLNKPVVVSSKSFDKIEYSVNDEVTNLGQDLGFCKGLPEPIEITDLTDETERFEKFDKFDSKTDFFSPASLKPSNVPLIYETSCTSRGKKFPLRITHGFHNPVARWIFIQAVEKHKKVFFCDPDAFLPCIRNYVAKANLKPDAIFKNSKVKNMGPAHRSALDELTDAMFRRGIVVESNSPYCQKVLIIDKDNGAVEDESKRRYRFVLSCVQLSKNSVPMAIQVDSPRNQLLDIPSSHDCFSKTDLKDGYFQLKLDPKDRKFFAFKNSKNQTFEFTRVVQGFRSSAHALLQANKTNFSPKICKHLNLKYFFDDFLQSSQGQINGAINAAAFLERLETCGYTISAEKSRFGFSSATFCKMVVEKDHVEISKTHKEAVNNIAEPNSSESLRSFIGLVTFFAPYIIGFSEIMNPMMQSLNSEFREGKWYWGPEQKRAFRHIKDQINRSVGLQKPDLEAGAYPLELWTDASKFCIAQILVQRSRKDGIKRLIDAKSRRLNKNEVSKSIFRKEALSLFCGLTHWKHLLINQKTPVEIYIDSRSIWSAIENSKTSSSLAQLISDIQHNINPCTIHWQDTKSHSLCDFFTRCFDDGNKRAEKTRELKLLGITIPEIDDISDPPRVRFLRNRTVNDPNAQPAPSIPADNPSIENPDSVELPFNNEENSNDDKSSETSESFEPPFNNYDDVDPVPSMNQIVSLRDRFYPRQNFIDAQIDRINGRGKSDYERAEIMHRYYHVSPENLVEIWPNLKRSESTAIRDSCTGCFNFPEMSRHPRFKTQIHLPYMPNQLVSIDICKVSNHQLGECLLTYDLYSKYIRVQPIASKDTKTILNALFRLYPSGFPQAFKSDNFSSFRDELFIAKLNEMGSFVYPIIAYQSNASNAEYAIRNFKQQTKYIKNKGQIWSSFENLHIIQKKLNSMQLKDYFDQRSTASNVHFSGFYDPKVAAGLKANNPFSKKSNSQTFSHKKYQSAIKNFNNKIDELNEKNSPKIYKKYSPGKNCVFRAQGKKSTELKKGTILEVSPPEIIIKDSVTGNVINRSCEDVFL